MRRCDVMIFRSCRRFLYLGRDREYKTNTVLHSLLAVWSCRKKFVVLIPINNNISLISMFFFGSNSSGGQLFYLCLINPSLIIRNNHIEDILMALHQMFIFVPSSLILEWIVKQTEISACARKFSRMRIVVNRDLENFDTLILLLFLRVAHKFIHKIWIVWIV